jgi:hypothetical protein
MEDSAKEHFGSRTGVLNTADEKYSREHEVGGGSTASAHARLEQEGST